ncbi:MAG: Ig-like domain-containing protein, partial [Candidatus Andersenbacteria bacterium]
MGNGTTTPNQTSPVEVLGVGGSGNLSNVTSVVAGSNRSCALKSDGSRVYCWGAGSSDPLENGITSPNYTSPVEILDVGGAGNLSNISMIDGSWEHICAVKIGGSGVYCWGTATGGSLGNGGTTSISGHITPVEVLAIGGSDKLFDVSMVTTGDTHTCALKSDGSRVYCWGAASSGRLGNGTSTSNQASPVAVLGIGGSGYLSGISAISAGSTHTCALKSDGSRVYCWGAAGNGRLGNGATTPNQTSPVEVLGVGGSGTLSDISAISAGTSHTCALKSDGSRVYCWGLNTNGRLGDASATQRTSPVEVKDVGGSDTLSGISAISAGGAHTCALKSDGSRVYCWGAAASGRLGNGQTSPDQTSPVEVLGVAGSGNLSGISQIAAGGGQTCALKSDGSRVYCWGLGSSGQRGDGSAGANQTSPVEVLGVGGSGTLSDISAISTGNSSAHTCALKSDGSRVYCWGAAGNGRLGNGATTPNQTSPVEVLGVGGSGTLSDISAISAGGSAYTCALKSSNSRIYCWGAGSSGQRGDGTTGTSQLSPVEVVTFSIGPFIFNGSLSAQTSTFNVTGSYGEEIMTAIHVSISLGSYHGLGLDDSNKPFVFTDDVSLTGSLTLTSGELIMTKLAGIISLAGDWSSVGGTFTPGTSTVDLIGGDQAISGSNTFYNLTKQETTNNSTHSTLSVQVSSIQTILNELDLDGLDENDMLQVRSSVNGTRHTWDVLQSDQTATFLDVQDSQTSTNDITCTNCTQGTNTDGDESSPHWAFGEGDPDVTPPTIDSLSPADNATDIATSSNLVITFDEAVTTESGNVTIYKSSDDSEVEAIDVTSGQVTGSGTTTITINPSSDLDEQTGYYVQIDATAFDDTAGNSYVGIADTTSWNFTTADETAPQVSSVTAPSNGSYTTGQNLDFTVNTTENVTVNTGGGTPRLELTIGATTRYASYTSGSGSSALVFRYTIQAGDTDTDGIILTSPLQTNGGTIRDAAANNLTTTFTSPNLSNILVDTTNPTIDSLSPADNATDIATSSNLVITFDEAVTTESGNVTIYKSSDDSEVEAIDVTSGQVTGSGTDTITINPSTDLDEQTEYYVLVEDAAFDDIPGNSFAGISDTTDWSFTTVDEEEGEEDEEEDVSSG